MDDTPERAPTEVKSPPKTRESLPMITGHILLVDDIIESRTALSLILRAAGYTVTGASSGAEVISCSSIIEEQFDLLLMDVRMPDMDGFTLCHAIKNRGITVPVIFLSALHDAHYKVRGLEAGAVDFIEKDTDKQEILARIHVQIALSKLNKQLGQALAESRERERLLAEDLEAAAAIQAAILAPHSITLNGFQAESRSIASSRITGDMYNFLPLSPTHVGLYLLDVSGHGTPAALVAAAAANLLQPHTGYLLEASPPLHNTRQPFAPRDVVGRLNAEYPIERLGRYFTIVYGVIDTAQKSLTYANAGHPEPILIRASGELLHLREGGPFIGVVSDFYFPQETTALSPGDTVVLYSDGVTDFINGSGERYGLSRFENLLRRLCEATSSGHRPLAQIADMVIEELLSFGSGTPIADDVSLLFVRSTLPQ